MPQGTLQDSLLSIGAMGGRIGGEGWDCGVKNNRIPAPGDTIPQHGSSW